MLSYAESLRFGQVSSSEMYYFMDDMVRAAKESKVKANISRAIVNFDDSDVWKLPSMMEMKRSLECDNLSHGRIKMDASIHAEYTSNHLAVEAVAGFSKNTGQG